MFYQYCYVLGFGDMFRKTVPSSEICYKYPTKFPQRIPNSILGKCGISACVF